MSNSIRETATVTAGQLADVVGIPLELLASMSSHGVAPALQTHKGVRVAHFGTAYQWIQSGLFHAEGRRQEVPAMLESLYRCVVTRPWNFSSKGGK